MNCQPGNASAIRIWGGCGLEMEAPQAGTCGAVLSLIGVEPRTTKGAWIPPFSHELRSDASGAMPVTPSQAHEGARDRDAGHDEMQAAVWRWLKQGAGNRPGWVLDWAGVEVPLPIKADRRSILGFADVACSLTKWMTAEGGVARHIETKRLCLFEIKPKIYSVGAVIRQCRVLHDLSFHSIDTDFTEAAIYAVVAHDDPKARLLSELYNGALLWNSDRPTKGWL